MSVEPAAAPADPFAPSVLAHRIENLKKQLAANQAVIDDLLAERARIVDVISRFYYADITLHAIQPVIALAIELNPTLVEQRR